jgi:hypothetical protein
MLTGEFRIISHVSHGPRETGDDPLTVGRESRDQRLVDQARFVVIRDAVLPPFDTLHPNRSGE